MSGLTQRDKDFFIRRISNEIEEKIKKAKEAIGYDGEKLRKQALALLYEDYDLTELVSSFKEKEKQVNKLNAEKNSLEREIKDRVERVDGYALYNWEGKMNEKARKLIPQLEEENYPELMEQVRHLEKVLYDSEAVIRIVTTPRRLQEALTSLLETYEIELEGLEKSIPDA
jgi:hypothetical protein